MPNTLNDIFAHLDNAKASPAPYEANQERRRKVEEAEHERKVKQAAESAVEKYHVYDDDYDVEDVEEPLVMIPKQNPGTPEAKAATMPASKKDMDDIADNNPFVQNLFKHSHKQVKQERPALRETRSGQELPRLLRPSQRPLPSLQRRRTRCSISLLSLSPHSLQRPLRPKPLIPLIPLISLTISPSTSSLTIPRQMSRTSSPTRAFRTKPVPAQSEALRMQKPVPV